MKAKIGTKIMFSYFILLIIVFLLVGFVSLAVLKNTLRRQTRQELKEQNEAIITAITKQRENGELSATVLSRFALINIDNVTEADVYVLSKKNRLIFRSSENLTLDQIKHIVNSESNRYITTKTEIKLDKFDGYVILIQETSKIDSILLTMRRSILLAMMIATFISLIIITIMQKSITKPIKILKNDMAKLNLDNDITLTPIRTGDEIEELYQAYNTMLKRLEKNMLQRKRFFQNASHELKTPLMSIQGYAEGIRDGVIEDDEIPESLDVIINKSQNLKSTVEEIIYLSKIDNDEIEYKFKEINLSNYIAGYIKDFKMIANQPDIEIKHVDKTERNLIVKIDKDKFESVLNNILSNGLRYAKKKITIEVSKLNNHGIIKIIDDGDGFKNNEEEKIFERFYKGKGGKSGLGLSITESIVKEHRGSILASNHIDGGAVFEIKLPLIS